VGDHHRAVVSAMHAATGGQRGLRIGGCGEEWEDERGSECDQQRDGKHSAEHD